MLRFYVVLAGFRLGRGSKTLPNHSPTPKLRLRGPQPRGEVEGPLLRVDATKIAVLLLAGLFKIEHILENAPTLWGLWH
jgi:hypothetical protein